MDDGTHAALSILDAGSRGQWPSPEWNANGGNEIARRSYEGVLKLTTRLRTQRERLGWLRADIREHMLGRPQSMIGRDCEKWLAALDTILKEEGT